MSIAPPSVTAYAELHYPAFRITFGCGPRVLVLPGKWQRIAAAVLVNADYTVIEAEIGSATHADVIVNTNPDLKAPNTVTYMPDNVASFLALVAGHNSGERFSHIVSL